MMPGKSEIKNDRNLGSREGDTTTSYSIVIGVRKHPSIAADPVTGFHALRSASIFRDPPVNPSKPRALDSTDQRAAGRNATLQWLDTHT